MNKNYVYAKCGKIRTLQAYGFVNPITHGEKNKMQGEVKKSIKLDDGEHKGIIKEIQYRTEPYNYTDVMITVDGVEDKDFLMKYSCPTNFAEDGKLMQLLTTFKKDIKVGDKIDDEAILCGARVKFMILKSKGKNSDKEYSNIVSGSVKPE